MGSCLGEPELEEFDPDEEVSDAELREMNKAAVARLGPYRERIEALLLEGLNSGPAVEMTDEDWDEMGREFDQRHGRGDGR